MTLFDQANLAEITHPLPRGTPGSPAATPPWQKSGPVNAWHCWNPPRSSWPRSPPPWPAGRLAGAGKIGIRVGKVIGRYKMAKHYTLTITEDTFSFTRNTEAITAEAALDGIYVIRTSVTPEQMNPAKVVATYKSLSRVERDFRSLKSIDLDLRPIHHYTETRVRAHVFICMLAAYLVWHLRQAWAPLTFTDEHRPDPGDPVAPARRSQGADAKAATKTTTEHLPARSFTALLDHLATLTRADLQYGDDQGAPTVPTLSEPTATQRRAFDLIDAPIPLTLK